MNQSVERTGAGAEDARLTPARKSLYASGDFTVNLVLTSLNMVYVLFFLTQVAGLRPELAGLVQLIGRAVDAITDPAMGRFSDSSRWRWGRRRPFFLIGALPFGISFALMWTSPGGTQLQMFAYYSVLYVVMSLSMTVLAVPYLALLPEMACSYDGRTSLNAYRNVGSIFGLLAAAMLVRPIANALGGGAEGYAMAGVVMGFLVSVPWLLAYAASWERQDFQQREKKLGLWDGLSIVMRNRTFRRLTGLYLCSRISMDIIGALLILYLTFVLGRGEDFELVMGLFIGATLVSLPFWLRIARRHDKGSLFAFGAVWWAVSFLPFLLIDATSPRWIAFVLVPLAAVGFAVVDLMAWSMLGEVVDEDDLATGERREGIYNGAYMFVRKLGGSLAVAAVATVLGAAGFKEGQSQNDTVIFAIRTLTAVGPALFLTIAFVLARNYPLTRTAHEAIRVLLVARDQSAR
ncbi:MAG: MFS transporter [Deltaproteobacteria bacterium]|nr:MFS transporter [Deltaproteobacteria bacterium]MBW2359848.1 MFS transporter [Deltaproteobacteria bacterium]